MKRVPDDEPVMVAWRSYRSMDGYNNTRRWAQAEQHVDGALWAVFARGFRAGQQPDDEWNARCRECGKAYADLLQLWERVRGNCLDEMCEMRSRINSYATAEDLDDQLDAIRDAMPPALEALQEGDDAE